MSFLGDLVNSIGGDKAPAPPLTAPLRPTIANATTSNTSKSTPLTPLTGLSTSARPVYKGTAGTITSQHSGNLKRKSDEITSEQPVKLSKLSLQNNPDRNDQRPQLSIGDTRSPITSKSTTISSAQAAKNDAKPVSKAPAKGSYAELMARAKEAQQNKTLSQVGMIKHQPIEKVKTSRLVERRKEDVEKGKTISSKGSSTSLHKPSPNGKVDLRRRSASPVKKGQPAKGKVVKTPSAALHAPAYKGTLGQAPKRSRDQVRQKKSSGYDDYLGTDEEDEGGYGEDDEYGYSDESDMEGGFDDMEAEERAALAQAKKDDAAELALEHRLKKEKMDRKQKLTALAAKKR